MKRKDVVFVLLAVVAIGFVVFALSVSRLKRWNESVNCVNLMSSIGCGARIWADDNSNYLADNFLIMSNELCTPKFLICPGDKIRKPAESWASVTTNNCSYEILRPGMPDSDWTNAYFRCTIHGYLGFADGTVFDGTRRRTKWP
ncbi:MAG TPA: hypothetical protein VL863_09660 [bacterium]|jgi:hypothetical protein|nr:hypothetical protein [bacterium]